MNYNHFAVIYNHFKIDYVYVLLRIKKNITHKFIVNIFKNTNKGFIKEKYTTHKK